MGDDTTRLDCRWREALVQHPLRDHDVGFGKRLVDGGIVDAARGDACAARHTANGNVVRKSWMDDGRLPGHREVRIDHRGKRKVVDNDRVNSISSHVTVAGRNDGWLFWNTDTDLTTADAAVRLAGQHSLADFARTDIV